MGWGACRRRVVPVTVDPVDQSGAGAPTSGRACSRQDEIQTCLVEALSGRFDEHHAEIARTLLDQIDGLSAAIDQLTTRAELLLQTLLAAGDQRAGRAVRAPDAGAEAPTAATVPADGTL